MNRLNNIGNPENIPEQVKDLFKMFASDAVYDTWSDTFEIESIDKRKVIVSYHGTEKVKHFQKECLSPLMSCVYSVMGAGYKIKVVKKKVPKTSKISPKTKKNIKAVKFFILGMIFVCIASAIILVMCNYIGNRDFRETFYITSSIKVDSTVRVVQVSDLHSSSYGENNKDLLYRIEGLKPDIIICTGDIVDSVTDDADYAISLAEGLSKIAPSYYIYGNNEVETVYGFPLNEKELDEKFGFTKDNRDETALKELDDPFEEKLEAAGMKVLKNEKETIKIKKMNVDVYGVLTSNPSSFWSYSEKAFFDYIYENTNNLKITAVHEPFIFEEFEPEFWGDLMICGHTHGGVVRLPVFGPLYTHEGGILPERNGNFVYGRYSAAGKPLFVSAGLENNNVFRINNQPELVVIDINKF